MNGSAAPSAGSVSGSSLSDLPMPEAEGGGGGGGGPPAKRRRVEAGDRSSSDSEDTSGTEEGEPDRHGCASRRPPRVPSVYGSQGGEGGDGLLRGT